MEIIGKLKVIGDIESFGANNFTKLEFVVITDEQYPQMLAIELSQDKCGIINDFEVGQDVKVSINLRGREWINPQGEAKYFNSFNAWKIELIN